MGIKIISGVNDLYTWCINNNERGNRLLSEWLGLDEHDTKIDIHTTARSGRKKVKWMCLTCNNIWSARLIDRTLNYSNCPFCHNKNRSKLIRESKLHIGINDLYTWCTTHGWYGENVLSEWTGIDNKGNTLDINRIAFGSDIRAKWKCNKGHEWYTLIRDRTSSNRYRGCPVCSNKDRSKHISETLLNKGINDLYTWCQDNGDIGKQIQSQYTGIDIESNVIGIHNICNTSFKKLLWKCDKGHKWYARVSDRTYRNRGCPYCSGNKPIIGETDLKTWCHNNTYGGVLLQEWTGIDTQNKVHTMEEFKKTSGIKLLWKCKNGHTWYSTIACRVLNETQCTICSNTGTSYPEQFLYNALKQVFPQAQNRYKTPQGLEFDIAIPVTEYKYKAVLIEYSPTYWHDGRESIDIAKKNLCRSLNLRFIQIIDDSYNELDHVYSHDYICDTIQPCNKTELDKRLLTIANFILKSLNKNTLTKDDITNIKSIILRT